MKLLCLVTLTSATPKERREAVRNDIRRYADLKAMTEKVWAQYGETFDERKFWGYGCHCLFPTDRPMSMMGFGAPRDNIDKICREWKLCQKCTRETHGEECIGEMFKYQWKWNKKNARLEIISNSGTCERELGECDRKFAYDLWASKDAYDESNNYFYGDFDRFEDGACERRPGNAKHECCGGWNAPYHWFNVNKQQCCPIGRSGIVKRIDESC